MGKTIDRYLLGEILAPFGIGLGLSFAVVSFAQVIKVSDALTGTGLSGGHLLAALVYSLPPLLGILIPVSSLFATLLAVGRLAADGELLALWAAGRSPFRLFVVPLGLGLSLTLLSGVAMAFGEPWGIAGLRDLMSRGAQRALAEGVRAGEFHEWVPGVTLYAGGRVGAQLTEVVFSDRRHKDRPLVVSAARGRLIQGQRPEDLLFAMEDGDMLFTDDRAAAAGDDRLLHFEHSVYRLDVGGLTSNKARHLSGIQEKGIRALYHASRDPRQNTDFRGLLLVTLHRRFAVPLAALIFTALAVPLGLRATSAARARSFLWGCGIVATYYYLGRAVELAARSGRCSPVLAAWLPDLLGMAVCAALMLRLRQAGRA